MPARTFINQQGTSNKFWTIEVSGAEHTVHYGRLGTDGQVKTKAFADAAKAAASAEKLIAEKLAKGYIEEGTATPPPAERVEAAQAAATTAALAAYEDAAPRAASRRASPRAVAPPPPTARRPAAAAAAPPLRSGLDLRPDEWALAAWRPVPDAPGPAEPFDLKRAAAAIRKAKSLHYGWKWDWRELPFAGTLTREAAAFWLHAGDNSERATAADVARDVEAILAKPAPSETDACALAARSRLPDQLALSALIDYLDADRVAAWLSAPEDGLGIASRQLAAGRAAHGAHARRPRRAAPAPGRGAARAASPTPCGRCSPPRRSPPADFYAYTYPWVLAAQVGLHDELQATVDAWPDELVPRRRVARPLPLPAGDRLRARHPGGGAGRVQAARGCGSRRTGTSRGGSRTPSSTGSSWPPIRLARQGNKDDAEAAMRDASSASTTRRWRRDDARAHPHLARSRDGPRLAQRARAGGASWGSPARWPSAPARRSSSSCGPASAPATTSRRRSRTSTKSAANKLRELVIDHEDASGTVLAREALPPELQAALGAPPKKLPGFVDVAALPPIVVGADGRLDDDAVACVLHACTQLKPDEAIPPLLEAVSRHADAEAFAWGLFEAWLGDGAPSKAKWAMLAHGPARRRQHRDQARPDDPRLAGGEPARAGGARPRRARRDRLRHGADAAQRHRREGQVQGAPAARPRGDGRDRRRQGHDQGRARGPDRAHVRARRGRQRARSRSAARRTRSRSARA